MTDNVSSRNRIESRLSIMLSVMIFNPHRRLDYQSPALQFMAALSAACGNTADVCSDQRATSMFNLNAQFHPRRRRSPGLWW